MTLLQIPATESDLLARAAGVSTDEARARMSRLSELERDVLELRTPIAGDRLSDREIARRLDIPRRDVARIAVLASSKLRHPSLGDPM